MLLLRTWSKYDITNYQMQGTNCALLWNRNFPNVGLKIEYPFLPRLLSCTSNHITWEMEWNSLLFLSEQTEARLDSLSANQRELKKIRGNCTRSVISFNLNLPSRMKMEQIISLNEKGWSTNTKEVLSQNSKAISNQIHKFS